MTDQLSVARASTVFTDPTAYADEHRFHRACAVLRRDAPVVRVESVAHYPFWAITRHADVMEIERQHDLWLNAPRPLLAPREADDRRAAGGDMLRTLIHMDAPDHPVFRAITADWFLPKSLSRLDERLAALARRCIDTLEARDGECDFVSDVAASYPLQVILTILGLPEEDFSRMLKLTQELFGSADPELRRGSTQEEMLQTLQDFFNYFVALVEDRRKTPTDDLASVIANAQVHGEPIDIMSAVSYFVIIATAGHDTTSSSIAGGLHALLDHPAELDRLRSDPSLINTSVEEMIRWVSPVKHFMRTNVTSDYELRGTTIPKGEAVLLSYPSANRDTDAFDEPDRFDVGRNPNRHLAFGFGAHHCLGAQLARIEGRALFRELLARLDTIELAGEPTYMQTVFVGGPKHLPVRCTFK